MMSSPEATPNGEPSAIQELTNAAPTSTRSSGMTVSPFRPVCELGRKGEPLVQPLLVAADSEGTIYVLERPQPDRFRLRRFASGWETGDTIGEFPRGAGDGEFEEPTSLVVDPQGRLCLLDQTSGAVRIFSADGRWLATLAADGVVGPLASPRDLAVNAQGRFFIADTNNDRLVWLSPEGDAGQAIQSLGGLEEDTMYEPGSLAVGGLGAVYVADTNNNRLLALAGEPATATTLLSKDRVEFPSRLRLSADGNWLFVLDRGNVRLQRYAIRAGGKSVEPASARVLDASGSPDLAVSPKGEMILINPARDSVAVLAFLES